MSCVDSTVAPLMGMQMSYWKNTCDRSSHVVDILPQKSCVLRGHECKPFASAACVFRPHLRPHLRSHLRPPGLRKDVDPIASDAVTRLICRRVSSSDEWRNTTSQDAWQEHARSIPFRSKSIESLDDANLSSRRIPLCTFQS